MSHFSYLAPDTNSSEQIRPKKWSSWVTQSPPLNLSVMLLEKFWDADDGEKKWKQKLIQKGANLQRYGSFPGWKPKRKYDRGETFVSLRGCMIRLLKTRHTGNWRKFSHLAWDFWVQWWWINPIVVVWGLSCHNHYTRPWFCGFGGDRQQCLYKQWQMCRAHLFCKFLRHDIFLHVCVTLMCLYGCVSLNKDTLLWQFSPKVSLGSFIRGTLKFSQKIAPFLCENGSKSDGPK